MVTELYTVMPDQRSNRKIPCMLIFQIADLSAESFVKGH